MISSLPFGKQISYAFGMMGASIMVNIISVIVIYLYVPPDNSGIPVFITQATIFGMFNAISIIMPSGRLVDALYDPFLAQASDRSKNPKGRRIPIMKKALLPSMLFCFLVFYPIKQEESTWNIVWLSFVLVGFYISYTSYLIPYYALLPELAKTSHEKVRLSTWQSVGYVMGIGIAANAINIAELLRERLSLPGRMETLQLTVLMMVLLAGIFMAIPVFLIDERKYSVSKPHSIPLKKALRQALSNRNFLLFLVADFSYFIAVTIISSGLLYFVRVLLELDERIGNKLMITMVLVSFLFYWPVNYLAKKIGKKPIVVFSLAFLSFIFLGIYALGKSDMDHKLQIYLLISLAAIPVASLNILPNAILAEIIEQDSLETNENKEGIYFAVRLFFMKIAQTFGIAFFTLFLSYGKDVGNDFGLRLNGILGFALCFLSALVFLRFKENKPE